MVKVISMRDADPSLRDLAEVRVADGHSWHEAEYYQSTARYDMVEVIPSAYEPIALDVGKAIPVKKGLPTKKKGKRRQA